MYVPGESSRSRRSTAETLFTPSDMPDFIWIPYRCKRSALNYRRSIEEIEDVRHVAYIGDSILRTSYCGNLFATFHGEVSGQCSYADDLMDYHYSDKSFSVPIESPDRRSDPRDHVIFSQRFVDNYFPASADRIRTLKQLEPVTHIVANIGMWFAALEPEEYATQVTDFLHIIIDTFGSDVKIAWLGTPSVSPGIVCYNDMKRAYLSRHTSTAAMVIASLRRRYQNLDIGIVDGWSITDSRPETSSDGRCVASHNSIQYCFALTLLGTGSGRECCPIFVSGHWSAERTMRSWRSFGIVGAPITRTRWKRLRQRNFSGRNLRFVHLVQRVRIHSEILLHRVRETGTCTRDMYAD